MPSILPYLNLTITITTAITTMPEKQLILALNAGSSSLKASLMEGDSIHICDFLGERLGTPGSVVHLPGDDNNNNNNKSIEEDHMNHETALQHIIAYLREQGQLDHLVAIGHRVVHGGTTFTSSVIVEDEEQQQLEDVSHLAPLYVNFVFFCFVCEILILFCLFVLQHYCRRVHTLSHMQYSPN